MLLWLLFSLPAAGATDVDGCDKTDYFKEMHLESGFVPESTDLIASFQH